MEASLREDSSETGWFLRLKIIPERGFFWSRMLSDVENHPWERILLKQDAFCRWKSSLSEDSSEAGWFLMWKIIPERTFLWIRMISVVENHPCERILLKQDAFCGWKIISERGFFWNRMISSLKSNPQKNILSKQDAPHRRKSSPEEHFFETGCSPLLKIIPGRTLFQIRMHSAA